MSHQKGTSPSCGVQPCVPHDSTRGAVMLHPQSRGPRQTCQVGALHIAMVLRFPSQDRWVVDLAAGQVKEAFDTRKAEVDSDFLRGAYSCPSHSPVQAVEEVLPHSPEPAIGWGPIGQKNLACFL